jgi:hypothetical protein
MGLPGDIGGPGAENTAGKAIRTRQVGQTQGARAKRIFALKKPAKKARKKTAAASAGNRKPRIAAAPLPAATPAAPDKPKENVARCPPPPELDKSEPQLKHLGGSITDAWNLHICNQVLATAKYQQNETDEEKGKQHFAHLAFLASVNPQDVLEGMMAAQLFASHAASMECYRRAMLPGQSVEGRELNLVQAAKLTRANAAQIEALAKHRNKGRQKITIEHVHVYAGGQAIVGNVAPGGVGKNSEVQPHAVTHAPGAPMWGENPQPKALPIPSNAERTLQDARRPITRRA